MIYLAQCHIWSHCFFSSPLTQPLGSKFPRSTKSSSGGSDQVSSKSIDVVALLQLIGPATSQKAEDCGFAGLLARLRHMSFMTQVPELLKHAVILDKGPQQCIVVRREHTGKAVSLGGPVQECPLRVLLWIMGCFWTTVHLREVKDVVFVVKNQTRAAFVIPVNIVDTVSWKVDRAAIVDMVFLLFEAVCELSVTLWTHLGLG